MLIQNFKQYENYVNIQQWKENFDIPSDVLFAVKLFNQKITSILYEMDDRPTLSYFFWNCFLILELAFKYKTISKEYRQNLLEMCLYHLFLYNDTLKNCKKTLTDHPYKNNKIVRMFSSSINSINIIICFKKWW